MSQLWNQKEELVDVEEAIGADEYDIGLMEALKRKRNLFETIVASLCPHLLGHQWVKRGLVLALFGGVARQDRSNKLLRAPQQIHVLIFGNHCSQKDVLLKAVHSVSPEAHYVCGNTATVPSLTHRRYGTLISRQFAICCIDEFDRMLAPAYSAIQEAMAHQMVTYIRNADLSSKWTATAVVAAVTPLAGEFDPAFNVWQNTKLNKSLLSKFDLIFVLVDNPDEDKDTKQANRILETRRGVKSTSFDLINREDLQQYISYTQKYISPVLTDDAVEEIKALCEEFSVNSISKSQTRNFEVLYRLTEARARLESRVVATKEDVNDVMEIIKQSEGRHYFACEYLTSTVSGRKSSKRKRIEGLHKVLEQISDNQHRNEFSVQEIVDICDTNRLGFNSSEEVLEAIELLNERSVLIKKAKGVYRLLRQ